MANFKLRLKAAREKREAADPTMPATAKAAKPTAKPAKPGKPGARDALWGSGITKRQLQQQERHSAEHKREQETLREEIAKGDVKTVVDFEAEPDFTPPDTMVPDGIELDESQQMAVNGALTERYAVIIGAAGTGKTTSVKFYIQRAREELGIERVRYMAFTGRAATNMKRFLPVSEHPFVDTIHGTLEYMPEFEDYYDETADEWKTKRVFRPQRTRYNKLEGELFVMEESGMTPIYLWNQFIDALPDNARILLIGDINQLPPVQGRSVLGFAMLHWPTYSLEKIHRQAEGDAIIENAHRILNGRMPKPAPNFLVKEMGDGSLETYKKTIGVLKFLHEKGKFQPLRDAFLTPKNVSTLGQVHFNEKLVHYFNPPKKIGEAVVNPRTLIKTGAGSDLYAVGDKVMLHQNDRDRGLTNGMIGVIQEISPNAKYRGEIHDPRKLANTKLDLSDMTDLSEEFDNHVNHKEEETQTERQASHITIVKFQNVDETVPFETAGDYSKLSLAYAFTCHKSQGGEYPTVVIMCHSADSIMLCREWLYTAVTRAQERVVILTNPISKRGLKQAINAQRIHGNTIEEKANSFIALMDKKDTSLPVLPEPEHIPMPVDLTISLMDELAKRLVKHVRWPEEFHGSMHQEIEPVPTWRLESHGSMHQSAWFEMPEVKPEPPAKPVKPATDKKFHFRLKR